MRSRRYASTSRLMERALPIQPFYRFAFSAFPLLTDFNVDLNFKRIQLFGHSLFLGKCTSRRSDFVPGSSSIRFVLWDFVLNYFICDERLWESEFWKSLKKSIFKGGQFYGKEFVYEICETMKWKIGFCTVEFFSFIIEMYENFDYF